MGDIRSVQMSDEERDEFLERGGTGVVSFPRASDEPPHSIPVSYGYEVDNGHFYFRLAFGPDSDKSELIDEETPVSFVTYDQTETGWQSVVATGKLDEVPEDELDKSISEAMRQVEIPLVDVFERRPQEVTFRFFQLVPDELTGRKEARADD
ncbi:pyridoxamine 5'-phosphate oxidase family protein [Halorussus halophilus]|uniref:pyridoxamine 5'-phosphate oxidase family protein n=1 Tax=Halorussus halophilus TaxID=2650975 RepID=UPI00130150D1|nr:pyridoxamine 5'-phosphate oxidase family protein [Halorussus halophilus]